MGDKRTKQRITSKIDELPEDLRMKVDVMSPAAIMALDNCLVRAVLLYPFTKHRMMYPLIALFCLISAFSKSFTLFTSLFSVTLH